MSGEKMVIGRRDVIDLPEYRIVNISAKVDTGAYTSAIHAEDVTVVNGTPSKLSFRIIGANDKDCFIETTDFTERLIKNSFGQIEKRFVVKTKVLVFNKTFETEFSLSDRSGMRYPVLLGRKFLKNLFVVDVAKLNISYKKKRRKERKNLS